MGSGSVNLGTNTLAITNGNGTFAGIIGDGGAGDGLTMAGGTEVLSGANTYTGATTVNGGTLAPGSSANPFAPLTINGSLSFTAASTYMVQASSTSASLANVTGAAALGGATVSAIFGSGTVKKQYTILTRGRCLGGSTFNSAVVSNMPSLNATLSYAPTTCSLASTSRRAVAASMSTSRTSPTRLPISSIRPAAFPRPSPR